MYGELLRAGGSAAGKENCLTLAFFPLKQLKNALIIEECVVIMHGNRITVVVIYDIYRDPLTEVSLETVNAYVDQALKLRTVPVAGGRICEINNSHPGLPIISLPDALTISSFEQIAFAHAFLEHLSILRHIRIDPDTDLKPFFLIALQHSFCIRENPLIPLKITPTELAHPEAVKMENTKRDVAFSHTLNK